MTLMDLIAQWVSAPEDLDLNRISTKYDPTQYHYLLEIIRYWNQLNFITQKTLRSLPKDIISPNIRIEEYIYIVYRYFWEGAKFFAIIKEIQKKDKKRDHEPLPKFFEKLTTFNWEIALRNKSEKEKTSIKYAIPSFIVDTLLPIMGYTNIARNIKAMDERARKGIFYFRVNSRSIPKSRLHDQTKVIGEEFRRIGVETTPDEDFPTILKANVKHKSIILSSTIFRENEMIIQDKASYSAVQLLDPQPDDIICDLCAAPGIKTSLIAHQTENSAYIVAGDFHQNRTIEMTSLLNSFSVTNTRTIQYDGIHPPLPKNSFDRILLDAPCTGSGTFTSNPVLKWRQNQQFLKRHIFLQESLLKSALSLLKVGGILVYSTCSLYPEEGEYQIKKIENLPLDFPEPPQWLPESYPINDSSISGSGRFSPADHNTIGFFVSKMVKKK